MYKTQFQVTLQLKRVTKLRFSKKVKHFSDWKNYSKFDIID